MYTGTKDANGYTSGGITLNGSGNGSLHSKNFYIDTSGNCYLKGNITAQAGSIGGWTIDATSMFTGTKDVSGYTSTGITINGAGNGSIHAKEFYLNTDGNAYFKGDITGANGTFSGALSAASGTIGGWNIDSNSMYTGSKDSSGYTSSGMTIYNGGSIHAKNFYVNTSGNLVARSVDLTGKITATSGKIGGWTIDSTSMFTGTKDTSGYTVGGLTINGSGNGSIHAKNFYIDTSGNCYLRGNISGSSITGSTITGSVIQTSTNTAEDRTVIDGDTIKHYAGGKTEASLIIGADYTNGAPRAILELGYANYLSKTLLSRGSAGAGDATALFTTDDLGRALDITNTSGLPLSSALFVSCNSQSYAARVVNSGNGYALEAQSVSGSAATFVTPTTVAPFVVNSKVMVSNLVAETSNQVAVLDTRGAQRAPSYYPDKMVSWDFQYNTETLAGGDPWHCINTIAKWTQYNNSYKQEQIVYTGESPKHRVATSDTTWGAWKTFMFVEEFAAGYKFSEIVGNYLGKVSDAGLLEVARYIDFHTTDSTADYDMRFNCSSADQLELNGGVFKVTSEIRATGNVIAYYSDERLKTVIDYLDPEQALREVCSWKKVRYTANNLAKKLGGYDTDKVEIGLLAGDIQRAYPEITPLAPFDMSDNIEGEAPKSISGNDYITLDYERISAIHAAAIEALNTKLERQAVQIEQLLQALGK